MSVVSDGERERKWASFWLSIRKKVDVLFVSSPFGHSGKFQTQGENENREKLYLKAAQTSGSGNQHQLYRHQDHTILAVCVCAILTESHPYTPTKFAWVWFFMYMAHILPCRSLYPVKPHRHFCWFLYLCRTKAETSKLWTEQSKQATECDGRKQSRGFQKIPPHNIYTNNNSGSGKLKRNTLRMERTANIRWKRKSVAQRTISESRTVSTIIFFFFLCLSLSRSFALCSQMQREKSQTKIQ